MKPLILLPIATLIASVTVLSAKLPEHAKLLPHDMVGLVTLHPGQILKKTGHQSLINKPMVANYYSTGGPHDWTNELDEDKKKHALITGLIEKPAETTGLDLSQPVYLVFHSLPKLQVQLFARLSDPEKFEALVEGLVDRKQTWMETKEGRRVLKINNQALHVHDGKTLISTGVLNSPEPPLLQVADQWFQPKEETQLPEFLIQQLQASPDLGIYFTPAPFLPFLAQRLEEGQKPPEYLKDTQLFLAANSAQGKLEATLHVDAGKHHELQFQSKPLGKEILGFLEKGAFLHATATLNMDTAFEHLHSVLPFFGIEQKELGEELLDEFKIDYLDIPKMFNGTAVLNLTGVELEEEEITFIAALGTQVPAAEVYVKLIHKGLFEAFKGEIPRRNPLERVSISAHGNVLLISSKTHADVLVQGKANHPATEELQTALKNGMFTLNLNFAKVLETLQREQQAIEEDEELEFLVTRILPHLKTFRVQAKQPQASQYQTTFGLHFQNSMDEGLKTLTHTLADLFNPHLNNPQIRPKLLAAEAKLQKDPEAFQKAIIGTWNGNFVTTEDQTYYKVTVSKDGTQQYEEMYISEGGYSHTSDSGTWSIQGTTYKDYDIDGGLSFMATILDVNDSTLTYVDYFEMCDEEIEPTEENPVNPKYQLPKPPKGLKELDDETIFEEVETENEPEPVNQKLPESSKTIKETTSEKVVSINRTVANLAGKHRTRFLLVDFEVYGEGQEFEYLIKDQRTKIQQATIQYLSSLSLERINQNPRIQQEVQKELHKKLNSIPEIDGKIKKLIFTAFSIQ